MADTPGAPSPRYDGGTPLTHRLLIAVLAAVIALSGGVMVWFLDDSAYKARIQERAERFRAEIDDLNRRVFRLEREESWRDWRENSGKSRNDRLNH